MAGAYVVMQVGRSAFVAIAGRGQRVTGFSPASRCGRHGFVIIALGESIVVIGGALAVRQSLGAAAVAAFVIAFAGSTALWWIYFDRSAAEGARVIAESDDPGRLPRWAYHIGIAALGVLVAVAVSDRLLPPPVSVRDRLDAS